MMTRQHDTASRELGAVAPHDLLQEGRARLGLTDMQQNPRLRLAAAQVAFGGGRWIGCRPELIDLVRCQPLPRGSLLLAPRDHGWPPAPEGSQPTVFPRSPHP